MTIKWLYRPNKTDSALAGHVISESEKYYTAVVVSWSHGRYSRLEGVKMLVRKDIAQIDETGKI